MIRKVGCGILTQGCDVNSATQDFLHSWPFLGERHQWGLAAAWLQEKPGRKLSPHGTEVYSCWLLQAALSAGTNEPQSSIVWRDSWFHQIQLIPDHLLNSLRKISPDLREGRREWKPAWGKNQMFLLLSFCQEMPLTQIPKLGNHWAHSQLLD